MLIEKGWIYYRKWIKIKATRLPLRGYFCVAHNLKLCTSIEYLPAIT